MGWIREPHRKFLGIVISLSMLPLGCARRLTECEGPEVNTGKVQNIKRSLLASAGPRGFLVMPNPVDATKNNSAKTTDAAVQQAIAPFSLPDLIDPRKLESAFVKIRAKEITDAANLLAQPDASGDYRFALSDRHYNEVMGYFAVTSIAKYVETLGFSFLRNKPLYVLANAEGSEEDEVNAYFANNKLDPSAPRVITIIGNTEFHPGIDRDMFWHEMGHYANESVSRERGIDKAADAGAAYTEASALHECTADFIAESLGQKSYIGKWINRNFQNTPGVPLRSAVDSTGNVMNFSKVSTNDGSGNYPERYTVAEWCTRVLWQVRQAFVNEDPDTGFVFADRLVLTAVSQLGVDATISQFYQALRDADQDLHCGLHNRSIDDAFVSKGFTIDPKPLASKLQVQVKPTAVTYKNGEGQTVNAEDFAVKIYNPNAETARNVRVVLEVFDPRLAITYYMQGYGDLRGGGSLTGGPFEGQEVFPAVSADIVGSGSGTNFHYRIRVKAENADDTIFEGDFRP